MADGITDGIFKGPGPFAIPLLEGFVSLDNPGHPEFALIRYRFEDGPEVHVPIANHSVVPLIEALSIHQRKLVEAEDIDKIKHSGDWPTRR